MIELLQRGLDTVNGVVGGVKCSPMKDVQHLALAVGVGSTDQSRKGLVPQTWNHFIHGEVHSQFIKQNISGLLAEGNILTRAAPDVLLLQSLEDGFNLGIIPAVD